MLDFEVYHLNHVAPEYRGCVKKILKSNHGLDESIIRQYTQTRAEELTIKESYKHLDWKEFLEEKCDAVRQGLSIGAYEQVASVKAKNIFDVITLTNSINGYWFLRHVKNITLSGQPKRDTRSYDLIIEGKNRYLINGVGVINLDTGQLLRV